MKLDPLTAIVGLALAAMSGAVCNHWAGLDAHLALARQTADQTRPPQPAGPAVQPAEPARPAPAAADILLAAAAKPGRTPSNSAPNLLPASTPAGTPAPATGITNAEQRMLDILERMHGEQLNLRDQVAEANRDLMELRFRVDSHSESFRPLRATQEAEFGVPDTAPGVLPPLDTLDTP